MAENQFPSTVDALFKGMDHFITSKTVVGEPVKVDENTTIIPLVDVTCGMAAGSFAQSAKTNGGGGMSAKMSPSAILVIQNGMTKLVNIKHQDAVTKVLDMVPDIVNRFTGGNDITPDAAAKAEESSPGIFRFSWRKRNKYDKAKGADRKALFQAVWDDDSELLTREMSTLLRITISYHDYKV